MNEANVNSTSDTPTTMDELRAQLAEKEALISYLQAQVLDQGATLRRIKDSASWRLTAPLRNLNGVIHSRILGLTRLDPVPLQHLELRFHAGGRRWIAVGDDPQFLLRPHNPAVVRKPGWANLTYEFECAQPVITQVFIDYGQGFQHDVVITVAIEKSGTVSIPLYLPQNVLGLRLDPSAEPTDFRIRKPRLKRITSPIEVDDQNKRVYSYLQSLENIGFRLKPLHQLTRNLTDSAHWTSHGDDPFFLLDFDDKDALSEGWHQAELCMHSSHKRSNAKFYFDTGAGFSENETLILGTDSGRPSCRIFSFTKTARAIRFDPKESEGSFRIETLRFNRISENEARIGMLQSLITHDPDFTGSTPEGAWRRIITESRALNLAPLDHLLARYNETFNTHPGAIAYEEWIETVEAASLPTPETVQTTLANMSHKPLISIVMPVYNTPEIYLRACIDSVLAQSYPHWELCIADDKSPKEHVRQILREYEQRDARIHVVYRQENGHISRASNSALEIATGEYVALLDHDDTLPEHALYFMALAIHENPAVHILYSDEDKLDTKGKRFDPHFKSDWNPDLFYSQNYVSHLGMYRRDLLKRIGGFRVGVEGSQDQDLLLRCLPHVANDQIIHIPRVLYHWRTVEGSTALASGEKSYTTVAGIKALKDYFTAHGPQGIEVETGLVPNTYRVIWPLPEPAPLVSLLIPTRDRKTITEVAVRSILDKTTYNNYEILILDNGSSEAETLEWFKAIQKEDPRVKVIRYDHPFNFSAINNFGVRHAKGSLIGLINNDVEVISPGWLTEMVRHVSRKDIGCVGAKLYYSNGSLQHAGIILGIGGVAGHSHKFYGRNHHGYFTRLKLPQALSAVTAACLLVRREVYEQVGGLDEENLKIAFNDVDFCLKVREAGYRNLWTPYAELYHHESISRGSEDTPEKQARFRKEVEFMQSKWGDKLKQDPYYSPNLTKDREDFSIGSKS